MSSFSFKDDFKSIHWLGTFKLVFLRGFIAGLIWTSVFLAAAQSNPTPLTPDQQKGLLLFPLMFPFGIVCWALFWIPFSKVMIHIFGGLGSLVCWIYSAMASLLIAVADPFVFILHKFAPKLVGTESYRFIDPRLVIVILDPEKAAVA